MSTQTSRRASSPAPGQPNSPTARQASAQTRKPGPLRRWLRGPADPPGAPFAAARRRLVLTTVLVVALALGVLSGALFLYNQHAAQEQTIGLLQYYAQTGSVTLQGDDGKSHDDDSKDKPLAPYTPDSSNTFVVALDAQGNTISDADQVQRLGIPVAAAARPVLQGQHDTVTPTVKAGGHTYQLYITHVTRDDHLVGAVVAGMSLDQQRQQTDELLRTLAIINGVALLLTLLSTILLTDRALRPARLAFIRQRQFATAASHELKTPLAVIRSEAELASGLISDGLTALDGSQANSAGTDQARGYLREALGETQAATSEVDYMARMVQGMLLLARDATDTYAHPWSDVDLLTLLDDVTAKLRPLAEREGLRIEAPVAPSDGRQVALVRGDADMLRQLFFGLLENAMRYTPSGGVIRVALREERRGRLLGDHRRHVYISVSDTGVGIAPEHLPHIFEPFYRVVSATRPQHPPDGEQAKAQHGAGLGLALAQWIVQAHGGVIEAQSAPGSGATFTVALPLISG